MANETKETADDALADIAMQIWNEDGERYEEDDEDTLQDIIDILEEHGYPKKELR